MSLEAIHPVISLPLGDGAPLRGARTGGAQVVVLLVSKRFLATSEFSFELSLLRGLRADGGIQILALLLEPCANEARSVLGDLPSRTLVGVSEKTQEFEVERLLQLLSREVAEHLGDGARAGPNFADEDLEELFGHLYSQHYPALVAFFGQRRLDPETSRDLAQATMLQVYRGLSGFQSRASSRSWVMRIALNIWRNWVRDQRMTLKRGAEEASLEQIREQGLEFSESQAFWSLEGQDPERIVTKRQLSQKIQDKIPLLSARQQDCLIRWLEGWSYQEMAEEMEVSVQTIRASLHRARSRIAQELRQELRITVAGGNP